MGGLFKLKENLYALKGLLKAPADALFVDEVKVQPYLYMKYNTLAGASAADYDGFAFIADRPYEVVGVKEVHQTAGSSTTASVDVRKIANGQAKASGTSVLAAVIDLSQAANMVQTPALAASATCQLAVNDRLGLVGAGTLTAVDGVMVQIKLKPI
jgi:hypothetical protein